MAVQHSEPRSLAPDFLPGQGVTFLAKAACVTALAEQVVTASLGGAFFALGCISITRSLHHLRFPAFRGGTACKGKIRLSALADLRRHSDVASLKTALQQLCGEFGRITRLDILTAMHEGTKQAICFLRLERPEQEQRLMKTLGVGRFGGEVVFVLNLSAPAVTQEAGPSSQWVDSDLY
jgi:hypothetical protein